MTDIEYPCSICLFYSQVSLCHYTRKFVFTKLELTLEGLRYSFGGYRPSQTKPFKELSKD